MSLKRCSFCNQEKDRVEFYKDKNRKDGLTHRCKQCTQDYYLEWVKNHPERTKELASKRSKEWRKRHLHQDVENHRKLKYGIRKDAFDILLKEQDNKCAVCGISLCLNNGINTSPHIDHDHLTNKLRGILCHRCNLGLGHFKDDSMILQNAINYLEIYK